MAKDDYNCVVCKILVYLYGCLKRKYSFDKTVFDKTIGAENLADGYLTDILRFMEDEGLIEGLIFIHAWGHEFVIANNLSEMTITPDGIQYLTDNGKMKSITDSLKDGVGLVAELVRMVL